ncbi:MAG TPA: hypothetical protein VFQ48_11100, partial [Pseudonocardiaceae bacterium]|nr:hypothetical protein [Pseudonocardiaceae bacterium]
METHRGILPQAHPPADRRFVDETDVKGNRTVMCVTRRRSCRCVPFPLPPRSLGGRRRGRGDR